MGLFKPDLGFILLYCPAVIVDILASVSVSSNELHSAHNRQIVRSMSIFLREKKKRLGRDY